jgi:hypothetical protein
MSLGEQSMKQIAIVLLLGSFFLLRAEATTLTRLDLDDLTAESSAVVYGKIVASRVEWNRSKTMIFTIYTVHADQYLKSALGPVFELHEPGGVLDGIGMSVAGVPAFTVGQEAVLFVWTDQHGQHQVTGFEQGSFPVRTDPQTGAKVLDRVVRLGSVRAPNPAAPPSSRSLSQFVQQVRASAARAQSR